jgi:hypothetical protein
MAAEGEGLLIGKLAGRDGLPDDIDGMKGIDPRNATGTSQVAGPDQVGLLEIAHPASGDTGIRGPSGQARGFNLFGLAGPGQDLFDGRDGGKPTAAASLELKMERLGADPGERRPAAPVGLKLVAESQDLAYERLPSLVPDMLGGSASIPKPRQTESLISASPLGKPKASPLDLAKHFFKADAFSQKPDCSSPPFIFAVALHRPTLLPLGMGRSLGDAISVCDVLTVF